MRLLGRVVLWMFAVIGAFTFLMGGLGIWGAIHARPAPLPKKIVLSLDVDKGIREIDATGPLAAFGVRQGYQVEDVVEALDKAARDPNVAGLVARIDAPALGMARTQELRDAVAAFGRAGKPTYAYSTGLDGTSLPYYLASSFGQIWLQPSGDVALTGFMAQSPLLKGALDLLDIKAEFGARHEYKSAVEMFSQTRFTKENRETLQLLIDSWTRQAVDGIAADRHLDPQQVRGLIDQAPLMADEAKQAKLVDRLAYWDELEKHLTEDGAKIVDLNRYAATAKNEPTAVKVALIYGIGTVQQGGNDGFGDNGQMSADRIGQAFRDAVRDGGVKAIVFRIDSPGGSYPASDAIWREVGNARAAGKPVVVSMGDVAASGGYFAAMAADRIVAEPGTITGSIGVFSGKLVLTDFWKRLGVTWDEVHQGRNAGMWSANAAFTPSEWDRLNSLLDHIYADFTAKAEQNRNLKPDDMDKLARGRIWPGAEAKQVGLVDVNGGYAEALVQVRQLAKLPSQMPVRLVEFPRRKPPVEVLMDMARSGRLPGALAADLVALDRIGKLADLAAPAADLLVGENDALRLPPIDVK